MREVPLIAIINDDPAFLEFLSSFLESESHYDTVVWDDGTDSLPKIRQAVPDFVILDVRLGDQAVGYEILKQMRDDSTLSQIPVLLCTADSQFINEHCHLLTALQADVLEKPFDLSELEEKVDAAIGHLVMPTEEADPVG
jgi:DNA-binding response OmpR family regulator